MSGRFRDQREIDQHFATSDLVERKEFTEHGPRAFLDIGNAEVGGHALCGAVVNQAHRIAEQFRLAAEDVPHRTRRQARLGRDLPYRDSADPFAQDQPPDRLRYFLLSRIVIDQFRHWTMLTRSC